MLLFSHSSFGSTVRLLALALLAVLAAPTFKHYDTLGLKKGASPQEIKSAYKKMALKWHPDKNQGNEEEATAKFREVGTAYEILSDDTKRMQYNQVGDDGGAGGFDFGGGDGFGMDPFTMFQQMFAGGGGFGGVGGFGGMEGMEGMKFGFGPGMEMNMGGFGGRPGGGEASPFGRDGPVGNSGSGDEEEEECAEVKMPDRKWNGLSALGKECALVVFFKGKVPGKDLDRIAMTKIQNKDKLLGKLGRGADWKKGGMVALYAMDCAKKKKECKAALGKKYDVDKLPQLAYYAPDATKGGTIYKSGDSGELAELDLDSMEEYSKITSWIEENVPDKTATFTSWESMANWARIQAPQGRRAIIFSTERGFGLARSLALEFQNTCGVGIIKLAESASDDDKQKVQNLPKVFDVNDIDKLMVVKYKGKMKKEELVKFFKSQETKSRNYAKR